MKAVALLLLFASSAWAADVTEKTSCPDLMASIEFAPQEAQLPVPINYDITKPVLQKILSPEDEAETRAILQDTMGPIQLFFPDKMRTAELKKLHTKNTEPWQTLATRARPRGIVKAIQDLDANTRKEYLERYVTSVLDYMEKHPDEVGLLGIKKKPSEAQIAAAQARLEQLRSDPHQRELLINALDSQFAEKAARSHSRNTDWQMECLLWQTMGLAAAGCGAFLAHSFEFNIFTDLLMGGGGLTAAWATVEQYLDGFGALHQGALKRAADRALSRYLSDAGAAGKREQFWYKWKFVSQKISQEEGAKSSAEEAITAQGLRLLNTSGFLHSLSLEELPSGERFSKVFKPGVVIPQEKLGELLEGTNRRLEQLEVLKTDLAQTKAQIESTHLHPNDADVMGQLLSVQTRSANQLAVSIEIANSHLQNIRNLIQLTETDQSNAGRLETELKELSDAMKKSSEEGEI